MGKRATIFDTAADTRFVVDSWGSGSVFGARVRRVLPGAKLINGEVVDHRHDFPTRSKARAWAEARAKELATAEGSKVVDPDAGYPETPGLKAASAHLRRSLDAQENHRRTK